jgi:cell wall-associated NlpC family hydrolase
VAPKLPYSAPDAGITVGAHESSQPSRPMSRIRVRPVAVVPSALLVLSACAQGSMAVSPGTILDGVILAGRVLNSGSSSSSSGSSRGSSGARMPRSPAPTAAASRVLNTADRYVGVPYVWGGNTPNGFDCSGFTKYVFAKNGVTLPRTSREQARVGDGVPLDFGAMRAGDLLLFAEPGEAISHVAIYVGSGRIIHASSAMGGVNYLDLDGSYGGWYVQNLVAVRRPL